jgi:hypothetical protein
MHLIQRDRPEPAAKPLPRVVLEPGHFLDEHGENILHQVGHVGTGQPEAPRPVAHQWGIKFDEPLPRRLLGRPT